ncbi:MAG TPA: sodium:solute symporter [Micromonosporaceae bacterium]|nr:sodium:solute symporter [Micromonosporaceae bacterium]
MADTFAAHQTQFVVFITLFAGAILLGFLAARWRRQDLPEDLEQWGLGGRAFGNFVTWFLLGGDIYTAYTLVALPALVYAVGAAGFFAVPYTAIMYPLIYLPLIRLWSVSHVHGFVTPSEFVRARFASRTLAALVAATSIVAVMPYIALQLVGLEAVFKVMQIKGDWPLWVAFAALALCTFKAGLRAPALISIVKDILLLFTVFFAVILVSAFHGGWTTVFRDAAVKFADTPSPTDGLTLASSGQAGYLSLVVGSALALFLYPHVQTGVLAAKNRKVIKRNIAALPVYTMALAVMALLGFVAISQRVQPVGGDPNTIVPVLFDSLLPDWGAGLAFAAIGLGALVPAAIMSIGAANLFTRSIYREYLRPNASAAEETRVGKIVSLSVKLGAVLVILGLSPQFSIDLQTIGGVFILQILPAVGIGLYSAWMHRGALIAGLLTGLVTSVALLYQIPRPGPDGRIVRAHFGGSSYPLSQFGFDSKQTVYVGIITLAANLLVAILGTVILRTLAVPAGVDATTPGDYIAEEGDTEIRRMSELVDGKGPLTPVK